MISDSEPANNDKEPLLERIKSCKYTPFFEPLTYFAFSIIFLIDYKSTKIISFDYMDLLIVGIATATIIVGQTIRLKRRQTFLSVLIVFALLSLFAVDIGISIDMSKVYEKFGLACDTAYWFFSGILQGFAALLAIIAGFLVLKLNKKDTESITEILQSFYPAIIFIAADLIISIILLPLAPVLGLEKYQSFLFTAILISIFLGIIGILWVVNALQRVYRSG